MTARFVRVVGRFALGKRPALAVAGKEVATRSTRSTRSLLAPATLVVLATALAPACAMRMKKEEKAAEQMPVNCATADGDIRVLRSEKAHVAEQIAMGVTAIYPAGLVIGLLTGTEGTKVQIATGEYNKKLDQKIAEIQSTCGLQ